MNELMSYKNKYHHRVFSAPPRIRCLCVHVAPPCEWKMAFVYCLPVVGLFWLTAKYFLVNFATIKKTFSRNISARIILVLDATFVPNST